MKLGLKSIIRSFVPAAPSTAPHKHWLVPIASVLAVQQSWALCGYSVQGSSRFLGSNFPITKAGDEWPARAQAWCSVVFCCPFPALSAAGFVLSITACGCFRSPTFLLWACALILCVFNMYLSHSIAAADVDYLHCFDASCFG